MGVIDVPQWLPAAFVRSVQAVGGTAPREQTEATFDRLVERWREPDRRHHNLRHVVEVLARVDELSEETHHPELVRLAAWYHGAVFSSVARKAYSRSGGEDEIASAELAREELGALGVPEKVTDRVAELIVNLKRHDASRRDIDCLALCDADLAILAADPQRYRTYREAVRDEYAHLPVRHYLEARTAIVSKLLARREIFVSPMGAQWEDAARENLSAELDRLTAELGRLGHAPAEESVGAAEAELGGMPQDSPDDDGAPPPGGGPGRHAARLEDGWHDDAERHSFVPVPGPDGRVPPSAPSPASARHHQPPHRPWAERGAAGHVEEGRPGPVEQRPSSLESDPDELEPRRRGHDDGKEVRAARDRAETVLRENRERAVRDRGMRARQEEIRAQARRRVALASPDGAPSGISPRTPTSAQTPVSADSPARASEYPWTQEFSRTPASPAVADSPGSAPSPARAGELSSAPGPSRSGRPAGPADDIPLHGIEREPDLFDRRRNRKERRRREGR